MAASLDTPLEVCVKQSITTPNKLGDCPFIQRVLLTLEGKHQPYDMKFVDLSNKPDWFLKINPEVDQRSSRSLLLLKSKDASDGREQALRDELTAFNDYLKENGPFINGNEVDASDLSLGPKLYHLEIALGTIRIGLFQIHFLT